MSVRENISQKFASYLSLKDRPSGKGLIPQSIVDPSLEGFIERLIEMAPQASEEDWSRCFLRSLLETQWISRCLWRTRDYPQKIIIYSGYLFICENGLFCYLQPSCWQAAKTVSNRLKQSQNSAFHYPAEECYLLACELSLHPSVLLRRFDFKTTVPLKAYARAALQQAVKDRIAKDLKSKSIKFSGLGRLKNLSLSRLENLLAEYGLRGEVLEQHRLLASVFKQLWETLQTPSDGRGRHRYQLRIYSLSDRQLSQIARAYNQQAQRLQWENQPIEGQRVKRMLETCLQAIQQNYETQRSLSLEDLTQLPEATNDTGLNPLDRAMEEEQQQDFLQVRQAVEKALGKLEKTAYQGLLLSLGLEINQSDLAAFLGVKKQYQVARQLQRYQRTVLRELVQGDYSTAQKMTAETEREVLMVVKDYLRVYSKRFFTNYLESAIAQKLTLSEKEVLINSREAGKGSTQELVLANLIQRFQESIEKPLNLELSKFQSAPEKIELFITEWLQQNQAIFY
ncbi:MAG: hypothetical protein ACLFRN_05280 [Halothece sp.]